MINQLDDLTARKATSKMLPLATAIEKNIPLYNCSDLATCLTDPKKRSELKAELATALLSGPGAFVLQGAYADPAILDDVSALFKTIINQEKANKGEGADHFAAAGNNDRIWNSLEKLYLASPKTFALYHGNLWIELASEAWLGPAFQMTAQVNLVRPGGKAQEGHCDYHLGFMTRDQVLTFPPHVHAMSAQLTLQGAVAHCDMPIESGTTKLLPFSQMWPGNYANFREPKVRELFDARHVQLPLSKGDVLFFSPGLMHGAGENKTSDVERLANLLQVSSALGQAMESINRNKMCRLVYPVLRQEGWDAAFNASVIASTGEGYPFPTNLDTDPPVGGLAPPSQQDLMRQGLQEGWDEATFNQKMDERENRRRF